jgi:hypothetical protein
MITSLTLADLDIRYENLRKQYPKIKKCSVEGCSNPRDITPSLGWDTCCSYHRLLFDFWLDDVLEVSPLSLTRKERADRFDKWLKETSEEELDKTVLMMANESINWEC